MNNLQIFLLIERKNEFTAYSFYEFFVCQIKTLEIVRYKSSKSLKERFINSFSKQGILYPIFYLLFMILFC